MGNLLNKLTSHEDDDDDGEDEDEDLIQNKPVKPIEDSLAKLETASQRVEKTILETETYINTLKRTIAIQRQQGASQTSPMLLMNMRKVIRQHNFLNSLMQMSDNVEKLRDRTRLGLCQNSIFDAIDDGTNSLKRYTQKYDVEHIERITERLQKTVGDMDDAGVTMSVGMAESVPSTSATTMESSYDILKQYDAIVSGNVPVNEQQPPLPQLPNNNKEQQQQQQQQQSKMPIRELDNGLHSVARLVPYTIPESPSSSSSSTKTN